MIPLHPRRAFVLIMIAIVTTAMLACIFPVFPILAPSTTGTLDITIDYTGTWYRETFGYTRQAPNIRHLVLVVPSDRQDEIVPNHVFVAIEGTIPEAALGPDEQWMLDYLYEAPEGYFTGQFEPGNYAVAVAFVADPLSQEEAGVPDDASLYPGVTGGGVSSGYFDVSIDSDKTKTLTITLTDQDGWACPWLYVYDGHTFERTTEILRNVNGKSNERTEVTDLGLLSPVDGAITVKVAEEKDEVSFIDALYLVIDGVPVFGDTEPTIAAQLSAADQRYLIIASGEAYTFRFEVPDSAADHPQVAVSVVVSGYYTPFH